jgi:hypothetical protein
MHTRPITGLLSPTCFVILEFQLPQKLMRRGMSDDAVNDPRGRSHYRCHYFKNPLVLSVWLLGALASTR